MKIVRIAVRNFLGIRDFDVSPKDGINVVRGRNGSGKSSFLKAIWKAFSGGRNDGPWVIHRLPGNRTMAAKAGLQGIEMDEALGIAEILVELDGSTQVRRRITENGADLQITKKEGPIDVAIRRPQDYLNALVPGHALNPVEFFKASPADRRRILLSAVPALLTAGDVEGMMERHRVPDPRPELSGIPIGLEELGQIEGMLMSQRREMWGAKEHHEEAAKAERTKLPPDYMAQELPDMASITARLEAANGTAASLDRAIERTASIGKAVYAAADLEKRAKADVEELELRLSSARVRLEDLRAAHSRAIDEAAEAIAAENACRRDQVDPVPIRRELAEYETAKEHQRAYGAAGQHDKWKDVAVEKVRALDSALRVGIRVELPALLWSRLEAAGRGFARVAMQGDRITVAGVDIDNLSTSEQVRLALEIARATAGELKVICVDQIESLDATARAAFSEHAANDGFQYFVAEVAEGDLEVASA